MKKYYLKNNYWPFFLTIISTFWFGLRVLPRPSRIIYPCQRIAMTQISLYLGSMFLPFIITFWRRLLQFLRNEYASIIKLTLIGTILFTGYKFYGSFKENELRMRGKRTIPKVLSIISPLAKAAVRDEMLSRVLPLHPLVSFRYDPNITYGNSSPYNEKDNPAYNLVWQTVEELGLGDSNNPLGGLIKEGDTVLIKPNLLSAHGAAYSHPSVVRPLIDMAIRAGATTIYVGDGSPCYDWTEAAIDGAHYDEMVSELQSVHPDIRLETINLDDRSRWHWMNLGTKSSFAGSGYSDYDLASSNLNTLYNTLYYATTDPHGVNPNGQVLGWYAISDGVLNADVVINVPKMKNHWNMINTLAIKNLVGTTVACTYDNSYADYSRIPHFRTHATDKELYFANDIYWRSILDVNKILIYADKEGDLQIAPQRKYLCVLDGIQANEKNAAGDDPYERKVVLASIDPVALDAVASRLMGYDFNAIWGIKKMTSETVHPIGTHDPNRVVVVGDQIDSRFNYIFRHDPNWDYYAVSEALDLSDFLPPILNNFNIVSGLTSFMVTLDISAALTAYMLYEAEAERSVYETIKNGNAFVSELQVSNGKLKILTQDEYFNTNQKTILTTFTQDVTSDNTDSMVLGSTDMVIEFETGPGGRITIYKYDTNPPNAGFQVLPHYWEVISNMTPNSFIAEVSFHYNESELTTADLTENELIIAYYNNGWRPLITTIDPDNNKVSTTVTDFAMFAIGNEGSVPVELNKFSAKEKDGKVVLNWFTYTETNCYGFEVERSKDDMNFNSFGWVKGKGTTNIPQSYNFTDAEVSVGTYFYRLKQIDIDGTFQYSQVIEVIVKAPSMMKLEQNYPNPFNKETVIKYDLPKSGRVIIQIYNLMTQRVKTLIDEYKPAGKHTIYWDGCDEQGCMVTSGIYVYQLKVGNFVSTKKMSFLK